MLIMLEKILVVFFNIFTNKPMWKATFKVLLHLNVDHARNKLKGWLAIATLKPTFTFLGRDFAIFNTFTWQNLYQKK